MGRRVLHPRAAPPARGRYSETRSGRTDAYTGRYWTRGDRIVYLDDSGFWAFGVRYRETLFHADFVMHRS
ncbi:Atu4866 domain-containing protein [Streptomyces shenzhenensis]|uniref:Atu4866 domain-containing protein n=1 Tax=Streptomyces shenzhenensis TaxID=943815 RepID=UPI003D8F19D7